MEDNRYSHSAGGWPGSVLCLGTPAEGRPLVFQNYDHKFDKWPAGEGPKQTSPTDFVKGDFFLPTDVRNAKITFGPASTGREALSEQPKVQGVSRVSRKEFSAPEQNNKTRTSNLLNCLWRGIIRP